jgi:histidinol-phosphate aminotransferase
MARVDMETQLRELGIEPAESQANFAWFDLPVPEGADPSEIEAAVVRGLAERGVIVRAGGALGKPGALRVTYGTPAENQRFLRALRELL